MWKDRRRGGGVTPAATGFSAGVQLAHASAELRSASAPGTGGGTAGGAGTGGAAGVGAQEAEHKLFVGQLPRGATEEGVRALFSAFGVLIEVCILRHLDGSSKGYP
ncbi:hypothetical protein T484DRAFT_1863990 [Baffinella frigidus]|nr:hypothetical protein T484DRAFT_1863990 [Cryptophyta sp. CCMP2293]